MFVVDEQTKWSIMKISAFKYSQSIQKSIIALEYKVRFHVKF